MKKFIHAGFMLLTAFSTSVTNAQETPVQNMCGTGIPSQQWEEEFQKQIAEFTSNKIANKTQQAYVIPVIIHVIHGGQNVGVYPNLAQGQLNSQITVLNNDFAGTGFNSGNYPAAAFAAWAAANNIPVANLDGNSRVAIANTNVQFCLATRDSLGNILPEPGIERINYISRGWTNPASSSFNTPQALQAYVNGTIKPATVWNVSKYFNIWISDVTPSNGLLGYATFPAQTGLQGLNIANTNGTAITDGVWCLARAFGSSGIFPSGTYMQGYGRGRTATHEVGHWLGLRHIWGDNNCATDYCVDTPTAEEDNYGSPSYPYKVNVCAGSTNGEMYMNFMDYTNDNAKYMFTTAQANRVQTAMANCPYRKFLGTHNLCSVSTVPATALFTSPNMACTGLGLNLTNTSTGWPPPSYTWSASGGTFSPSPQVTSPSLHFPAPGVYTITLSSSNGTTAVYTRTINVTTPDLFLSSTTQTICEGKSATFYANGVETYTWQPGNVQNSIGTFNPLSSQVYTISGTQTNGCKATSTVELVVSPCVGVDAYKQNELSMTLYPNPANETLNLQINGSSNAAVSVEMYDAVGRLVSQQNIQLSSSGEVHPLDISGFDNGIYFIKAQGLNASTQIMKFVKAN